MRRRSLKKKVEALEEKQNQGQEDVEVFIKPPHESKEDFEERIEEELGESEPDTVIRIRKSVVDENGDQIDPHDLDGPKINKKR